MLCPESYTARLVEIRVSIECFASVQALVEAETKENIRFTIRLWRKNNQQIIVESQKIDGCCFLFCQAAKAVLRAAKGQAAPPKRKFALPSCVPRESEDSQKSCIQGALEVASNMLKMDRMDSHMMAIDTLLHISKASQKPAYAARCILTNDEFRSTLLSLIECRRLDRSQAETPLGEVEEQHMAILHRNALSIVANCFAALQQSSELADVLAHEEFSSTDFLAALLQDVSECNKRPHDACEALRCLRPLVCASVAVRRKVLELGAQDAVESAAQEGACRHALLENACTNLRCEM